MCADSSEETAALSDLVSNGAKLTDTVDCLLNNVHTLNEITSMYIHAFSIITLYSGHHRVLAFIEECPYMYLLDDHY